MAKTSTTTKTTEESTSKTSAKANKYDVPKGEENSVHAEIEQVRFDAQTGERLSKSFVQKWRIWEWKAFLKNTHGLTINEVLHLPDGAQEPEAHHMTKAKSK